MDKGNDPGPATCIAYTTRTEGSLCWFLQLILQQLRKDKEKNAVWANNHERQGDFLCRDIYFTDVGGQVLMGCLRCDLRKKGDQTYINLKSLQTTKTQFLTILQIWLPRVKTQGGFINYTYRSIIIDDCRKSRWRTLEKPRRRRWRILQKNESRFT